MATGTLSEKAFPHNLEAERALLGSVLMDNGALNQALEFIDKDDFFSDAHRTMFEKMLYLSEKNRTIDLVTLSEELSREGLLEKVGGAGYVSALTDGIPIGVSASIVEYSRIIKAKSLVRQLINASNNVISRCFEGVDDVETLIDQAQSQVFEIGADRVQSGFMDIRGIVKSSFGDIERLLEHGQATKGIRTGFEDLDNMTSGLQPGELIIIAARPSLGKTALALNIAANAAIKYRKKVGIFSLEMSKESLIVRLLCSEAEIDSHAFRAGFLNHDRDWPKITKALGRLAEAPLYIEDTPALSIMQIRTKARRLKAEKGLDLLMVDYLQLITGGNSRYENRTQEVSFISRGLKSIAKELNIPVVALSQLSRAPEQRQGNTVLLSDLRESGSIEQDADLVIFIHREKKTVREDEEETSEPEVKLVIGKQRNGPTGDVPVVFLKRYVKFGNRGFEQGPEPY